MPKFLKIIPSKLYFILYPVQLFSQNHSTCIVYLLSYHLMTQKKQLWVC